LDIVLKQKKQEAEKYEKENSRFSDMITKTASGMISKVSTFIISP